METVANGFARGNYPAPHVESQRIFWSKVDRENGPIHPKLGTRCWPWTGATRKNDGYGRWAYRVNAVRTHMQAHRFAWLVTRGDPGSLCVCHHCDNRLCCSPEHQFLGTTQENTADMKAKGREARGGTVTTWLRSKILACALREIRAAYGNTEAMKALAVRYDVHPQYIRALARRARYFKWLDAQEGEPAAVEPM